MTHHPHEDTPSTLLLVCQGCGKEYRVTHSQARKSSRHGRTRKFCTPRCVGQYRAREWAARQGALTAASTAAGLAAAREVPILAPVLTEESR